MQMLIAGLPHLHDVFYITTLCYMVKESMPPQISARPYNMELMVQQIAKKKEEEEEEPP